MQASDFGQWECQVGKVRIPYFRLLSRTWVCAHDGGRLDRYHIDGDFRQWAIRCHDCHGQDFIPAALWEHQVAQAAEVLAGLPEELKGVLCRSEA